MRASASEASASMTEESAREDIQPKQTALHSARQPGTQATAATGDAKPSSHMQPERQQSGKAAGVCTPAPEPATDAADAAAVDNSKKRKADAEALQLAQTATAVVVNAGKRRASPEAEVSLYCDF